MRLSLQLYDDGRGSCTSQVCSFGESPAYAWDLVHRHVIQPSRALSRVTGPTIQYTVLCTGAPYYSLSQSDPVLENWRLGTPSPLYHLLLCLRSRRAPSTAMDTSDREHRFLARLSPVSDPGRQCTPLLPSEFLER
jgi:hypothetical protein